MDACQTVRPLTVFTPAYNRADLLPRCFASMQRQTRQDFVWMIIDDGSTDGTEALVDTFRKESFGFSLEYYRKENGGLHTAYNEAIAHLQTPLSVCIDSDDYMPDDAVEKILSFWEKNGSDAYAGIVGLDYTTDGKRIGDELPDRKSVNLIDLLIGKYKIRNGDRTNVVRSELYRKFAPMRVFEGEKNFNPHYMHLQISLEYDFLVLNENLRFVEYQPNGMSRSMLRQYRNSPNSFAETRKLYLSFPHTPVAFRFRHSVHYVSSCILAGRRHILRDTPRPFWALLAYPAGLLLSRYIRMKVK